MSYRRPTASRCARRRQLEEQTPLVAIAAARAVVEEASRWLGEPLPARYAAALAHRARRIYAHSPAFRAKLRRPADRGRDALWIFLRHWLADRLLRESPDLFRRLPRDFASGGELPARPIEAACREAACREADAERQDANARQAESVRPAVLGEPHVAWGVPVAGAWLA